MKKFVFWLTIFIIGAVGVYQTFGSLYNFDKISGTLFIISLLVMFGGLIMTVIEVFELKKQEKDE